MLRLTYAGLDGCALYAFRSPRTPRAAKARAQPVIVLLHGGGYDHRTWVPLARGLSGRATVVLPDLRGHGLSECTDPARHTWAQYASDVVSLLDHLGVRRAVVGGVGLGATVALRAAVARPDRVAGLVLNRMDDAEADAGKGAKLALTAAIAGRLRARADRAAWAHLLGEPSAHFGASVRERMTNASLASLAAAAAIGRDRSFRHVTELLNVRAPMLVFARTDRQRDVALVRLLAEGSSSARVIEAQTAGGAEGTRDEARVLVSEIEAFLRDLKTRS